MDADNNKEEELRKEIAFYKKQLNQLTGKGMHSDMLLTAMRHALKQKSDVFAVLTTLQKKYTVTTPLDTLLAETIKAITANLGMHRSVALVPTTEPRTYQLSHHYGYPADAFSLDQPTTVTISPEYLQAGAFMLVNKTTDPDESAKQIQTELRR